MPTKSIYLVVGGRVQGVGFRHFALCQAEKFRISGWIKNRPDGRIEIEAEGEAKNIELFIDWIRIGPSRAIIQTFHISEITPARHFVSFTIR